MSTACQRVPSDVRAVRKQRRRNLQDSSEHDALASMRRPGTPLGRRGCVSGGGAIGSLGSRHACLRGARVLQSFGGLGCPALGIAMRCGCFAVLGSPELPSSLGYAGVRLLLSFLPRLHTSKGRCHREGSTPYRPSRPPSPHMETTGRAPRTAGGPSQHEEQPLLQSPPPLTAGRRHRVITIVIGLTTTPAATRHPHLTQPASHQP